MPTYITAASVRQVCGIGSSEISDGDVNDTIDDVEANIPKFFNTAFVPTERIDVLDGDSTNRLLLDKNPVLAIREMKIDGDAEDVSKLEIYKESGYVYLGEGATTSKFPNKKRVVVTKYLHGTYRNQALRQLFQRQALQDLL